MTRLVHRPLHRPIFSITLRYISTKYEPRFIPSTLDEIECVEEYRPGGFHPMFIGDEFAHGRYRVIHKLGFGGSSTIWLVRDQQKKQSGGLVTLKAMRADVSSRSPSDLPEISVPVALQAACPGFGSDFQTVEDNFRVQGPNGEHQFLVSPLAGPSVLAMADCPGRVSGSRRLRGDLARKVAKCTAHAIYRMHTTGFVHGDVTTSNILFHVSEKVRGWSDDEVYRHLGPPETEEVRTRGGRPRGPHAPAHLVAPIPNARWTDTALLQERVLVIDFGQSYALRSPPDDYEPGTAMHYQSPEARFDGRAGLAADVWGLGCALFEIRAGFPLFDAFLGSDADVLRQTVETLGQLPNPWWASFAERALWFNEDGEPKSSAAQERTGLLIRSSKSSIREKLWSIGTEDDLPDGDEGPMVEKPGTRLREDEVELLDDLLQKMLRYRPEERIGMEVVVGHPWFSFK
ncbi:kinase-like domain-containing protein [Mycena latifolia]|nr:kinase-like domain-containing protein [Mycena latifolia]